MQFTEFGLDRRLEKTIEHLGYSEPTAIQQQAIPHAMQGVDLLASSKTGSGKTMAYLLPAMQRMLRSKALSRKDPRTLILAPTRELAKQVFSQVRLLVANTSIKACLITGGENFNDQRKVLAKDPHIVVATPGRLADHLDKRHLYLEGLELLILDEADRMLDLGFSEQLRAIDRQANHRKRQTLMFSATLDDQQINNIAMEFLKEPVRIGVGFGFEQHQDIAQHFSLSDNVEQKELQLAALLEIAKPKQAIIFTATRSDTQRLAELFSEKGYSCCALSAELNQSQRNQIMDSFSRGQQQLLFTTDVASRGLDIVQVSHVVNFDMPKHVEEYVHRVGRTGRAGNQGEAYSLVGPKDWQSFTQLRKLLEQDISWEQLGDIQSEFTGLKERKARPLNKRGKTANKAKQAKSKSAKPVKRNRTFQGGQDIGDAPIRRSKPAQGEAE